MQKKRFLFFLFIIFFAVSCKKTDNDLSALIVGKYELNSITSGNTTIKDSQLAAIRAAGGITEIIISKKTNTQINFTVNLLISNGQKIFQSIDLNLTDAGNANVNLLDVNNVNLGKAGNGKISIAGSENGVNFAMMATK